MSSSEVKSPSLVTTSLLTVSIIFPILGTIAVCLRIYASFLKSRRLFLDDYIIILAQLCAWGISIDTFTAASIGGLNYTKGDVISATIAFLRVSFVFALPSEDISLNCGTRPYGLKDSLSWAVWRW